MLESEEEANKRTVVGGKHGRNGKNGKNGNNGKKEKKKSRKGGSNGGTGSECKEGRSKPTDKGEIYMVTLRGSAKGHSAPPFVKIGFTNNCRQRFGDLKAGNPFQLNCRFKWKVCNKKDAEDAAHGAVSSDSIDMGGGTEWFHYRDDTKLLEMRQSVRTAIDPWIEEAGSSSDLVESPIYPCLAPNQAGAIMPTNYENFNPRLAGVYNTKWRQTLQGNVLQIKYNCK